ncbi:MAG: type I restriction enzyme HsdR N-terminal domain-containing protein [Bacteroidota bacterium]
MKLPNLIFPAHEFSTKSIGNKNYLFDNFRKKWIQITPEEWVRQNLAHYLVSQLKFPAGLMVLEGSLKLNGLPKRFDLLVYGKGGLPVLLAECKSSAVKITQNVFDQASHYNIVLGVPYLLVTNGLQMFVCKINSEAKEYAFLEELPEFGLL